uniref:Uncharacterized protein n=1 Tax=Tanacetum cinerariifolium TaxID=118510 RepID=A0A6L2JRD4_TANCI|nr:hypothetical protein [Tanacetum cinerariifolium]
MYSPSAPTVPKTITPTDRAKDSLVITPLHDDPYMLVRRAYTPIATDIEFEPFEDPIESKETQPLSPRAAPLSPNNTLASQTTTLILHTQMSFTSIISDLPIRKSYRGTFEPILDTKTESEESEDEGPRLENEEAAPEGQQQHVVPVKDTTADEPLVLGYEQLDVVDPKDGTIYIDNKFDAPPVRVLVQTPTSPEWSSGSLPISPTSLTVSSPVASPVTTPAATIAVEEDKFLESATVRGEIHSHRFKLGSLKRGHEQATIIFSALWRLVLALGALAG